MTIMKKLADGNLVSSRSFYFLLDWNDNDRRQYMDAHFQNKLLRELPLPEFLQLFKYAAGIASLSELLEYVAVPQL